MLMARIKITQKNNNSTSYYDSNGSYQGNSKKNVAYQGNSTRR